MEKQADEQIEIAMSNLDPSVQSEIRNYLTLGGDKDFVLDVLNELNNNSCCPELLALWFNADPVAASTFIRISDYYENEKKRLALENPDWSANEVRNAAALSVFQTGLDIVGMIPAVGEVADLVNGAIYLVQGDIANATISAVALWPVGGQVATGSRLAFKVVDGVAIPLAKNADEISKLAQFSNKIDNTVDALKSSAKIVEEGTGTYKAVGGHHPMAKKAFEGAQNYKYKDAFSVSASKLDDYDVAHSAITGKQNSLYSAWKNSNPSKSMSIDEMADIEIRAMQEAGIPNDVAEGWVLNALEDLKSQGVFEIKNIPWNGVNP